MSEKIVYCPNCGEPVNAEVYSRGKVCPRCFHSEKKSLIVGLIKRGLIFGKPESLRFHYKCELIAEKLFRRFENSGFTCTGKQTYHSEVGGPPYEYRKFESPMKSPKTIEVKVEFLKSVARIRFEFVYKEGGFLSRGKESKKFEFNLNPDELASFIDDGMIVKDEAALQQFLNGYLETMDIPLD